MKKGLEGEESGDTPGTPSGAPPLRPAFILLTRFRSHYSSTIVLIQSMKKGREHGFGGGGDSGGSGERTARIGLGAATGAPHAALPALRRGQDQNRGAGTGVYR